MRTVLLLLAMLAAPALVSAQTVWKWVDDKGVTHYSDRPMPGATKMELSVGSTGTTSAAPSVPSASTRQSGDDEQRGPAYRTISITSPAQNESVVNTGGLVQVNVQVEPSLRPGHELHLYLDGQRVENASGRSSSFSLTEVPRGEHTLVAVIADRRGSRVQESDRVTFYVRQTSVANPPVGPALRNPPRQRSGGSANKLPTQQPSYADLNDTRSAAVDPRTNRSAKPKKP